MPLPWVWTCTSTGAFGQSSRTRGSPRFAGRTVALPACAPRTRSLICWRTRSAGATKPPADAPLQPVRYYLLAAARTVRVAGEARRSRRRVRDALHGAEPDLVWRLGMQRRLGNVPRSENAHS